MTLAGVMVHFELLSILVSVSVFVTGKVGQKLTGIGVILVSPTSQLQPRCRGSDPLSSCANPGVSVFSPFSKAEVSQGLSELRVCVASEGPGPRSPALR